MTGATRQTAWSLLAQSIRLDGARLTWTLAMRAAAVSTLLIVLALRLSTPDIAIPLALGAAFTGMTDTHDAASIRLRIMTLTAIFLATGTFLGSLVSANLLAHLLLVLPVAWVSGFAGGIGPRTAMGGVLTLVLFTVFAGVPVSLPGAALSAGLVLAGAAAYAACALSTWPLFRIPGTRAAIADAYRAVAFGALHDDVADTAVAAVISQSGTTVAARGLRGATADWATTLVGDAAQLRLGLVALTTEQTPEARELVRAVGVVCRSISRGVTWSWRLGGLPGDLQQLSRAAGAARSAGMPEQLIENVTVPLITTVELLAEEWPVGSRLEVGRPPGIWVDPVAELRPRLTFDDMFFAHAIRLAVAVAIGTAVAHLAPLPYQYWIPMTIVWITKPDLAGTAGRVLSRLLGTLLGVAFTVAVAGGLHLQSVPLALVAGLGCLIVVACLWASYTVAVAGITTMVIALFALLDQPVVDTVGWRVLDTVLAGIIVVLVALAWPNRTGGSVHRDLALQSEALQAYAGLVLRGASDEDLTSARDEVLRTRTKAETAALAACQEPFRHHLDPRLAQSVEHDLRDATAELMRWDTAHEHPPEAIAGQIDEGLRSLADRLETPELPSASWRHRSTGDERGDVLLRHLSRAHARLSGEDLSRV